MDEKNQVFSNEDIQQNKVIAALAYLIFFLPLIAAKDSAFGKFHANQGLILLLSFVIVNFLYIIPILGWVVAPLISIALTIIGILGAVNAYNGKAEELPVIGQFNLINK
jgi:uncharacterized membrane protein